MRSSYGTNFSLTLFGESHGPAVGFVLDGLPAGIELDLQNIRDALTRRRPAGKISTQRQEADEFRFLSGFYKGRTCGTPLTFVIENTAQRSEDYDEMQFLPRPSHADYAAFAKYGGYQDPRGGGHFSGRVTAGLVAAGAIFQQILSEHGVTLGTHVKSCQDIADRPFAWDRLGEDLASLLSPGFPVLDETARRRMLLAIEAAQSEGDSLGAPLPDAGTDRVYGELSREMRSLALIGMPSCGKTTLGRLLAAHMGRELVDLDEKIARDAGLSIPEIFAREGETGFRARETAALREVAGRQGLVVATGGGIVKNPENVRLLRANAAVCFVQRGLARLSSADPSRPLSTSAEALARMYAERLPLYTAAADFSVSNEGAAEETARAIEDQFKEMCR